MKTVACITTRNEADNIAGLIRMLITATDVDTVVVVDAGSTDLTPSIASYAGAKVHCVGPMPIGPAMRVAWQHALDLKADSVIQLDAGGSHSYREVPRLLEALRHWDLAIGSRFVPGAGYVGRRWRDVASRAYGAACRGVTGVQGIYDWTSGYRAFRATSIRYLLTPRYFAQMHAWQAEVLYYAAYGSERICEVPIHYVAGKSAFRLSTAVEAAQMLARFAVGARA